MANLALALDEIIQQDKKVGGSPRQRGGGGRRARAAIGGGFAENGMSTSRSRFPQRGFVSGDVPEGRWKHDKFFEVHGGKGGSAKKQPGLGLIGKRITGLSIGGSGKATGGIAARLARKAVGGGQSGIIKLQVSNLPASVITSDLEDLFREYNCYGVTVHYDEAHNHLGTADMFTDQQSANQILRDFKNIAVDGKAISFLIVAEPGAASAGIGANRPSIRDRLRQLGGGGGGVQKKRPVVLKKRISGGGRVGAARAGAAGRKARVAKGAGTSSAGSSSKAKTAEDLDMELDAYMQKK